MKTRTWLVISVIVAAGLVLLFFVILAPRETDQSERQREVTNRPQESQRQSSIGPQPASTTSENATVSTPASVPATAVEVSNARHRQLLAAWQAPIDFFGKVVDENGNPVSGASVQLRWSELPLLEGGDQKIVTESDSYGLFSLQGKRGKGIEVWVSKDGYYAAQRGYKSFTYALGSDFSPDPLNPVVFNLRKKGQGAEVITSEKGIRPNLALRVPRDNTPIRVDFFQKQPSLSGQLEISQNKPPRKDATEWSFRLSISDGGFIENSDEFQFEAPETNYVPTVEYRFTKGETNWTTQVTKQFYIAFGQPRQYGWLRIESNLSQETVFLTYAINPTGSRNLEPLDGSR